MISQMRNVRAVLCVVGRSVCASVAADECNFRADSAENELNRELTIPPNMWKKFTPIVKVYTYISQLI